MKSAQPAKQGVKGAVARSAGMDAGRQEGTATEVLALLLSLLARPWTGHQGETYELSAFPSRHSWTCTRLGRFCSSKKFTLWLDESSGFVWWGNWSYYFDPSELSLDSSTISWYRSNGAKATFTWTSDAPAQSRCAEEHVKPKVPATVLWLGPEEPDQDGTQLKAFSLPEVGVKALPEGFRPPPGLEMPDGLELYEEMPSGGQQTRSKVSGVKHADEETSAGSAGSDQGDSEIDTDLSESEGSRRASAKQILSKSKPTVVHPWWKVKEAKALADEKPTPVIAGRWRKATGIA